MEAIQLDGDILFGLLKKVKYRKICPTFIRHKKRKLQHCWESGSHPVGFVGIMSQSQSKC
jgi:hypothetical protein